MEGNKRNLLMYWIFFAVLIQNSSSESRRTQQCQRYCKLLKLLHSSNRPNNILSVGKRDANTLPWQRNDDAGDDVIFSTSIVHNDKKLRLSKKVDDVNVNGDKNRKRYDYDSLADDDRARKDGYHDYDNLIDDDSGVLEDDDLKQLILSRIGGSDDNYFDDDIEKTGIITNMNVQVKRKKNVNWKVPCRHTPYGSCFM